MSDSVFKSNAAPLESTCAWDLIRLLGWATPRDGDPVK